MDLLSRLNEIENRIQQLKDNNKLLNSENQQLKTQLSQLQSEIKEKEDAINNLEEQNKIAKLAGGLSKDSDSSALEAELEGLIQEIDQCINLVKR